jgi:hypothetical protein
MRVDEVGVPGVLSRCVPIVVAPAELGPFCAYDQHTDDGDRRRLTSTYSR